MIIISTGIPKSATTLIKRWQEQLIEIESPENGMTAFIERNVTGYGSFVVKLDENVFRTILDVEQEVGSLIVKMHAGPCAFSDRLIAEHGAKVTCCYRDPRAVILSAMDHGKRTRAGGDPSGAFASLLSASDAADACQHWFGIYEGWQADGRGLMLKYETVMDDLRGQLFAMRDFLGCEVSDADACRIYEESERMKAKAWNFNRGDSNRWRSELSLNDLTMIEERLGECIVAMGYDLVTR